MTLGLSLTMMVECEGGFFFEGWDRHVDFNNLKVVSREERRKENFKVGKLLIVGFPCYVT
jgi:hypothetical protein